MPTRTARSVASSSLSSSNGPALCSASQRPSADPDGARATQTASPRLRLATARTGDHPSIHAFLVSVFHGPTSGEFQAQLDEPGYDPADRLIVKDGDEIAAHLRLARQTIQLGSKTLPAARVMDLATAPEFRSRGLATALLAAGERAAAERGILVVVTRTRAPSLFARHGWAACGSHVFSTASPRAVLAELAAARAAAEAATPSSQTLLQLPPAPLIVRPLRRIELPAVVRLYEQARSGHCGWPVRDEAYWEWLLARGASDRVYIAATAPESVDFKTLIDSIVGYCCVRQSRIVELIAADSASDIPRQLAERVCADAREEDGWEMRCDAPATNALHQLFRQAGGRLTINQEFGGEVFMAKLLDPLAVLRRLAHVFAERAAAAGIARPAELGIELRAGGGRVACRTAGVVERFRI